jgi:prepilin-type N-terminal cleavage/methylation domain-containing protein
MEVKLFLVTPRSSGRAFTLIELIVVVLIIAVLVSLAFPSFQGVQNQLKRAQARNDLTQIVTAVSAFYAEYGKYPLATADAIYGPAAISNAALFNELRATAAQTQNPRQIIFISPPDAKDPARPRSGIGTSTGAGQFFDPWGVPYHVEIDGNYNNQIDSNPYSTNAGSSPLRGGVIAWSFGKDGQSQSTSTPSDKNIGTNKDDIISWQ